MPTAATTTAALRNGRMIEAETETAEIPIKKTAQVVLAMGSTSGRHRKKWPRQKHGRARTTRRKRGLRSVCRAGCRKSDRGKVVFGKNKKAQHWAAEKQQPSFRKHY